MTLGIYQVKLAKHYTEEHTNQDGTYEIDKHFLCLLVSKLQSRHISNCRYQCWIRYSEGAVTSWYCRCQSGARVVGACVNITSVIWYLAYARHANMRVQTNRNWLTSFTISMCQAIVFFKTDYSNIFCIILILHFTNVWPWI